MSTQIIDVLQFTTNQTKNATNQVPTPGPLPEESTATLSDFISRDDPTKVSIYLFLFLSPLAFSSPSLILLYPSLTPYLSIDL
jgi:hypothetical protein